MDYTHDIAGKGHIPQNVAERLSRVSKAPIFGLLDISLGYGIVGGSLINFERIGTKAGELVLDILRGTKTTEDIPKLLYVPAVPMFDWRQLRHWNLSEAALPKGSIVENRESTFWDYKYYIIGILAVGRDPVALDRRAAGPEKAQGQADEALEERLRFERFLSDLSAKFLNIAPHEIDREIKGALGRIVDFFHVTQCLLIQAFPEESRAVIMHAAHGDDVLPTPLGGNLYDPFPWTSKVLSQNEIIRVSTLDDLPAEAAADKEMYQNLGVRSFLIIPLFIGGIASLCHLHLFPPRRAGLVCGLHPAPTIWWGRCL